MHGRRIVGADGQELEVVFQPSASPVNVTFDVLTEIGFVEFERCPICLEPNPLAREHIPQKSLGGHVRTVTCLRCNNDLGSRVEADLQDWFDGAMRGVRVEGSALPGRRSVPRVLTRQTPDGNFVHVFEVRDDAASRFLRDGSMTVTYSPPERARYKLAALKHSYLAACCAMGQIPVGPKADEIRAELLAGRDAVGNEPFPKGRVASALDLMRSTSGPVGPPLAVVAIADDAGVRRPWISLAGVVLVKWPLDGGPTVARANGPSM